MANIEDIIPFKTNLEIQAGRMLISEPLLRDESFHKSVIFMCHHDALESVGYVFNKQSSNHLSHYIKELGEIYYPLYIGGPVGHDSLHIVHTVPSLIGGDLIDGDIYWGGDLEAAIEQIKLNKINSNNCRFFLGYSGWSEGQLDAELDMNAWLVAKVNTPLLFETNDDLLWKEAITALGSKFNPLLYVPNQPEFN